MPLWERSCLRLTHAGERAHPRRRPQVTRLFGQSNLSARFAKQQKQAPAKASAHFHNGGLNFCNSFFKILSPVCESVCENVCERLSLPLKYVFHAVSARFAQWIKGCITCPWLVYYILAVTAKILNTDL
jgi:hypothetical protein